MPRLLPKDLHRAWMEKPFRRHDNTGEPRSNLQGCAARTHPYQVFRGARAVEHWGAIMDTLELWP
jgi:hypothetical protein